MKGHIHHCFQQVIIREFGIDQWRKIIAQMNLTPDHNYGLLVKENLDEEHHLHLFEVAKNVLNVEIKTLFDHFGRHWCIEYAPEFFEPFYRGIDNTKSMIIKLDDVHRIVANHYHDHPPRFEYEWISENEVIIQYISKRNLIDLFISLINGLDEKFNCKTSISKLSNSQIKLQFQV